MDNSIAPYIHRKIVVLHENDSAFEAAKAMTTQGIGSVVVSDNNGRMTGVVTDRDIASRLVGEGLSPKTELRDIMTSQIAFVHEDATLEKVIDAMKSLGVRRIPVLQETKSDKQRCVGLVSLDDLIAGNAINKDDLADIVRSQISRRSERSPRLDQ